ncbi:MSHA biogenesis protein MshQ [Aeromonas hydrophila]|uniref:DUF6701 domain-containing protein n=1 Tax=Aeromonas TaxID=642 RepID=UPI0007ECA7C9|nr:MULTISPECIES: DUF6701 domain-containing protein [Aeromonas]OBR44650.1 MSHA biogenesis protein MshQ [Aeromonas dhakensis]TNH68183.1 MSHA biogenesis protein MshQ [Aeromonas hydrophila]TNH88673.1 MSHA biogenesis protein MshQ [Aeromonas hydrophila]TNI00650.1 MSHA biogenesis protein MshQ [Aeromonas hydrophila]TNI91672.1 MSHA biogenesis protein MshQ [Aeromonas hydrophila]
MRLWLLVLTMLSGMAHGFETVDTDTYFPAVVQGHRGNNNAVCTGQDAAKLTQNNQAKITGTAGAALNFCDSNQGSGMPLDGCDNANGSRRLCSISGSSIRGMSTSGANSFLSSSGGDGSLGYCNAGQQLTMGSASQYQFGAISLYSACTLTFSSARNEYRIESLAIGGGAKVILPAGDYWIGSLTINQGGVIETQGAVRIFVNEQAALNDGRLNPDNLGSVLLFGYADINLNESSLINGLVYSDKTLNMNGSSIINGRITSRSLFMTGSTAINDKAPPVPLACFSDDFSASSLSNSWVVARSSGNFTPAIVNGRLGMTQASTKQSTSATYQRLFPAANNLVTIEFDQYAHSGNGADGMAVVLSDARVTPQPGAFGGPLGYGFKTGVNGFAGGWLGVGIDEYGNFSGEGGTINKGRRQQSVAVRGSGSGTNGYNYLKGTCNDGSSNTTGNCLSPTVDSGSDSNRPHRYRLTIDSRISGQSLVKVERNTGSGYSTLIDSFNAAAQSGQVAIPENLLLSLTGSTGDLTNAHQIDNVQICALNSSPVGTQIDHFEFDHSGNALTCNPETLTIRACANASCSTLVTGPVSAVLTPLKSGSNGWVAGSQVSYSGNTATVTFSGGTTKLQLRNNLASAMTVGVSGSTPSTKPLSTTLCRAGSGALSAAACTLNFADSGFVFDVLDTLANRPQQVVMKAVKKDDASQQCVPSFASVSKPVSFWSDYVSPASNAFGSKVTVNGSVIATSQGAATTSNLSFDTNGETTFTVNYPDAGQMRLNARHDGSGDSAGLVMTGSDLFVSRPVGLCITSAQGACTAGDASCPVFKKTGEAFQLNIKGVAWQADDDKDLCSGNLATPNFVLANIALGSELVAPKPGVEAVVGTASYDHSNAKGSNNLDSVGQSVNEVGVFRMTATPPEAGYFNYTIPPAVSVPVGRFIPVDFNLVSGNIVPACDEFSYMGQPFLTELHIQARNQFGETARNYREDFAKGNAYLTTANNRDGVSLSARLRSLGDLPWLAGEAVFNGPTEFVRRSDDQPDGPYRALLFGLYMQDNDGEQTLIANPDFNDGQPGSCSGAGCNARLIDEVPMEAYFGRVQAGTRQGIATAGLAVPLQLQYHEAGAWHAMGADQCTRLSLQDGGMEFTDGSQHFDEGSGDLVLDGNTRIRLGLGPVAPGAMVDRAKDGVITLQFAAPGRAVRIPFRIDLGKQPESELQPGRRPLWLSDPDSLDGMAIFGLGRGNDRIIYRREVMH